MTANVASKDFSSTFIPKSNLRIEAVLKAERANGVLPVNLKVRGLERKIWANEEKIRKLDNEILSSQKNIQGVEDDNPPAKRGNEEVEKEKQALIKCIAEDRKIIASLQPQADRKKASELVLSKQTGLDKSFN